jgi:hypothetical protein
MNRHHRPALIYRRLHRTGGGSRSGMSWSYYAGSSRRCVSWAWRVRGVCQLKKDRTVNPTFRLLFAQA